MLNEHLASLLVNSNWKVEDIDDNWFFLTDLLRRRGRIPLLCHTTCSNAFYRDAERSYDQIRVFTVEEKGEILRCFDCKSIVPEGIKMLLHLRSL